VKLFVRSPALSDDEAFARHVREAVRRRLGARVEDAGTLSVLLTDVPGDPAGEKRCSVRIATEGLEIRVVATNADASFAADVAIDRAADLLGRELVRNARVA
jgi:hypothetical protein